MSPAIGELAVMEAHRLRQVNARLLFALQVARAALDAAVVPFTGRKRINGMTGWDKLAQLPFTQSVPAPLTITGINMRVQV